MSGPVRVRTRLLEASAYRYRGGADEVPAVEALAGPVARAADGSMTVTCPVTGRTTVLKPGMAVVRFDGEECRVVVTSGPAYEHMYEEINDDAR